MPKLIDLAQGSKEWLAWRKWKLGASSAAAIMGISPWQTPMQLWESIVLDQGIEKNFAMQRGSRLEEVSRHKYNNTHLFSVNHTPVCLVHDSIPWMIASMDGAIVFTNFGATSGKCEVKAAIEIKCPGKEAHSLALQGIVPEYYLPQLYHQMVVCNLQEITYISFDGEKNVEILVKRDDEYITKKLMPALASFYQSLIDFKPPEPSDRDVIEIIDSRACIMAEQYKEISTTIQQLQEQQESLKEELCVYATHGRCRIGNLNVTKVMRRGNVDFVKFLKDKDLKVPESYRKENSISWKISQT